MFWVYTVGLISMCEMVEMVDARTLHQWGSLPAGLVVHSVQGMFQAPSATLIESLRGEFKQNRCQMRWKNKPAWNGPNRVETGPTGQWWLPSFVLLPHRKSTRLLLRSGVWTMPTRGSKPGHLRALGIVPRSAWSPRHILSIYLATGQHSTSSDHYNDWQCKYFSVFCSIVLPSLMNNAWRKETSPGSWEGPTANSVPTQTDMKES